MTSLVSRKKNNARYWGPISCFKVEMLVRNCKKAEKFSLVRVSRNEESIIHKLPISKFPMNQWTATFAFWWSGIEMNSCQSIYSDRKCACEYREAGSTLFHHLKEMLTSFETLKKLFSLISLKMIVIRHTPSNLLSLFTPI